MTDKLQELTEKLYNEGLEKGRKEAEALLAEAGAKAEAIVAEAEQKAAVILKEAQSKAADKATRTEAEVQMASRQALSLTRSAIESLVLAKAATGPAEVALADESFVKELIAQAASASIKNVEVSLPASASDYLKAEIAKIFDGKAEIAFSKNIKGGFTIGPKDGGYILSFTDETFAQLISSFLREETRKLIFG